MCLLKNKEEKGASGAEGLEKDSRAPWADKEGFSYLENADVVSLHKN
jgi:hypothetical protein